LAEVLSQLGERLLAVHDSLDAAGLPHAIGGAIALGYCTLDPRPTHDLDLNVFVEPRRANEVFAALPAPVRVTGHDLEQAERKGEVRLWWEGTPIDIFFDVLPFHRAVAEGVRHVPFEDRTIPIVGGDTLAVFKALFDHPRHWEDVEALIVAKAFDVEWAVAAIREMDGESSAIADKLAALRPF
jgi:hypothetical protein